MKNIVLTGAAALMMLTACKKDPSTTTVTQKTAEQEKIEYQARQIELEKQKLAIEKEKLAFERAKDSLAKVSTGPQQSLAAAPAATNTVAAAEKPKVITKTRTVYRDRPARRSSRRRYSSGNGGYADNSSSGSYPVAQAPARRQPRYTHTQKGTVVGAVTGAAAGAILNKQNRGAGAVIGGIIGGATGYGIGRTVDRREGIQQPR